MLTIAAIGNEFRGDDAIGIYLVKSVQEKVESDHLTLANWGDPDLLTLTNLLLDVQTPLLIVDSMHLDKTPGAFKYMSMNFNNDTPLTPPLIRGELKGGISYSNHGSSLKQAIPLAIRLGFRQPLHLFGVQPYDLGFSNGLSREMKERLPMILEMLSGIVSDLIKDE